MGVTVLTTSSTVSNQKIKTEIKGNQEKKNASFL